MIRMPWTDSTAPNFVLEITDACNVKCRSCYKAQGASFKSKTAIEKDLEDGLALRPAHTVTISGGEPTLHPELTEIIRLVKRHGLHVFLLSNGVLADRDSMRRWHAAGLDSILFHLEIGQERADLPNSADYEALGRRLRELVDTAHDVGLDVSVSTTLYDNEPSALDWITDFVFDDPRVGFLFLSKATDINALPSADSTNLDSVRSFFTGKYGIEPFSFIPSTGTRKTCWISYFVPIAYRKGHSTLFRYVANRVDLVLIKLHRRVSGRFTHKLTQRRGLTTIRALVNGVTTGRLLMTSRFLWDYLIRAEQAGHKMIVYDDGPALAAGGLVEHCEYCPTAVVRDGRLLACCTADRETNQ